MMKKILPRFFSMRGAAAMLTRAGRAATALLAVAMLTLSAQTAKADNVLYATVSGTEMTLAYGEESSMPDGAVKYDGSVSWNSSFRGSITSATVDASCANYDGTTLQYLFDSCWFLETITSLSNLCTTNVTTMESLFSGCQSLTSIDLSGFNTAKVTNMQYLFRACLNLTSITFGDSFSTAAVTNMFGMFQQCESMTSFDLSNFDTRKVIQMNYMFRLCKSLTSLDLSNFNTEALVNMPSMFSGCTNLTSLDLSSFNTANVINMKETFKDCTNLKTIWVGKNWTINKVKSDLKDNTFSGCTSLVGGNGTACDGSTNVSADYAIVDGGTSSPGYLRPAVLYATVSGDGKAMTLQFGVPTGTEGTDYYRYSGQDWNDSFKSNITGITIDGSCNRHTLTDLGYLFCGFNKATNITGLSNLNTAGVTSMDHMFARCNALQILDLSAWNTADVENMTSMFEDDGELKAIIAGSDWSTDKVTTSDYIFNNCIDLCGGEGSTGDGIDYAKIDEFDGYIYNPGLLTGTTRTQKTSDPDSEGMRWATFFNSAVGYTISEGEAYAGVYNSGTQTVTLTSLGTNIPANTPVVICTDNTSVTMTVNNTLAAYTGTNSLQGTDTEMNIPEENTYCLAIGGNKNGDLNGKVGFFGYTGANIPARHAYMTISSGSALARGFIGFGGDDENTTGIALPEALQAVEDGEVYDLSGRRVSGQPQKGIYVKNGKKFVIK